MLVEGNSQKETVKGIKHPETTNEGEEKPIGDTQGMVYLPALLVNEWYIYLQFAIQINRNVGRWYTILIECLGMGC